MQNVYYVSHLKDSFHEIKPVIYMYYCPGQLLHVPCTFSVQDWNRY
jgi:hypothetical protein